MKEFIRRNLVFIIGTLTTIIVIVGGVFLFSGKGSQKTGKQISAEILNPQGVNYTSGYVNGNYLPRNSSAPLTLVEFGDYQCPACGIYSPITKQLLTEFPGKINYVFRNFPLSQHSNANISSYAAEAAGLQNKFWEMHYKLYETQGAWSGSSDPKTIFTDYAKELGLDVNQFKTDISSQIVKDKVSKDTADGYLTGLNSTPTYFLNGYKLEIPGSYEGFKKIIQDALNESGASEVEAYDGHFDLKVYLNGTRVDFGLAKYQSGKTSALDPDIQLKDGNGNLVHIQKSGVLLDQFFNSLKMTMTDSCFTTDTGKKFCNNSTSNLKMYVNGVVNTEYQSYIPKDLDRILISYGPVNDKNLSTQINSVTDLSCIYSLKCPERGSPPSED